MTVAMKPNRGRTNEGTTCAYPEDDHAAAGECIDTFRAVLAAHREGTK